MVAFFLLLPVAAVVICCGLPFLILGVVELLNRPKIRQPEIPSVPLLTREPEGGR